MSNRNNRYYKEKEKKLTVKKGRRQKCRTILNMYEVEARVLMEFRLKNKNVKKKIKISEKNMILRTIIIAKTLGEDKIVWE